MTKIKAWAGFTDGKLYRIYSSDETYAEYAIYKTREQARRYFRDVRRVEIKEVK